MVALIGAAAGVHEACLASYEQRGLMHADGVGTGKQSASLAVFERAVGENKRVMGSEPFAFSLLMGQHKTHPDSSQFPFSYLFGDDRGATVVGMEVEIFVDGKPIKVTCPFKSRTGELHAFVGTWREDFLRIIPHAGCKNRRFLSADGAA